MALLDSQTLAPLEVFFHVDGIITMFSSTTGNLIPYWYMDALPVHEHFGWCITASLGMAFDIIVIRLSS